MPIPFILGAIIGAFGVIAYNNKKEVIKKFDEITDCGKETIKSKTKKVLKTAKKEIDKLESKI